ncbi:MAG: hypothetical protein LBQ88_12440 [Treponema sp.]|jgi:hypothetical protein|nr:hypothetical protein [Treponema sp.]
MIGLTLSRQKWIDLDEFADNDLEAISAKSLALIGSLFAKYLRENKLSGQVLRVGKSRLTGKGDKTKLHQAGLTRYSTRPYSTRNRYGVPSYMVRPGVGVPGHLNYLYGMSRGYAVANTGKWFEYKTKYEFFKSGWREFKAGNKMRKLTEAVKGKYMQNITSKNPIIETIEV